MKTITTPATAATAATAATDLERSIADSFDARAIKQIYDHLDWAAGFAHETACRKGYFSSDAARERVLSVECRQLADLLNSVILRRQTQQG